MGKGCVYILTNPCIRYTYRENGKELTVSPVKIGMAKDVEKRLGSLNTSLPENFVHHMSVFSNDSKALENIVHRLLAAYRIDTKDGDRTEFFRCSVEEAVAVLKQTAKDMHLKEHKIDKSKLVGRSSCKIKSNSRAAREAKKTCGAEGARILSAQCKAKQANFSFAAAGVPVGAQLEFTEAPIVVSVADAKNKVTYRGETYSLSGFVKTYHPHPCASGSYQGPKFFRYQGNTLVDLRDMSIGAPGGRTLPRQGKQKNAQVGAWKNSSQLAQAIVMKFNEGKSKGHLWHILNRKRSVSEDSKWRGVLEGIGLLFDSDDLIVDWRVARLEDATE